MRARSLGSLLLIGLAALCGCDDPCNERCEAEVRDCNLVAEPMGLMDASASTTRTICNDICELEEEPCQDCFEALEQEKECTSLESICSCCYSKSAQSMLTADVCR